jgi:hypothetical protein
MSKAAGNIRQLPINVSCELTLDCDIAYLEVSKQAATVSHFNKLNGIECHSGSLQDTLSSPEPLHFLWSWDPLRCFGVELGHARGRTGCYTSSTPLPQGRALKTTLEWEARLDRM